MSGKIYRPEHKHPEPYQQDLNPDAGKGINWGSVGDDPEASNRRTAKDVDELHNLLSEWHDDELERIPVLPPGARLESNATYLNLRYLDASEFTAEGSEDVGEADLIVAKKEVDYELWNKLLERTQAGVSKRPR